MNQCLKSTQIVIKIQFIFTSFDLKLTINLFYRLNGRENRHEKWIYYSKFYHFARSAEDSGEHETLSQSLLSITGFEFSEAVINPRLLSLLEKALCEF
jgi:hypothetical protein